MIVITVACGSSPVPWPVPLLMRKISHNQAGVFSSVDTRGEVIVTNDDGSGKPALLSATPDNTVVVSNDDNGAVASTTTDKAGVFKVTIKGATEDRIRVHLIDPDDPGTTSDFVSITVP